MITALDTIVNSTSKTYKTTVTAQNGDLRNRPVEGQCRPCPIHVRKKKRTAYVCYQTQDGEWREVQAAKAILLALRKYVHGKLIRYHDGDPRNLRAENLYQ